jgi:uncharacterized protein
VPFNLRRRVSELLRQARSNDSFLLPLFPLDTVLFPGGRLALKVFEPRYVEMINACLKREEPFGISLIRDTNEPEQVGCLVNIIECDTREPGTLNIEVTGASRFRMVQSHTRSNGLIVAQVDPVAEEPFSALPPQHQACATTLRRIVAQKGEDWLAPPFRYDDAVWVGYRLAELLPLKRSARQSMLEMNDSLIRLEILHGFLTRQGLLG